MKGMSKTADSNISIMNVCRTCTNSETTMVSIFIYKIDDKILKDVLIYFTSTEVQNEDMLPQTICKTCVDLLEMFMKFRRKCEESEKQLRTAFTEKQWNNFSSSPEINIENSVDSYDTKGTIENCDPTKESSFKTIEVINNDPEPVQKQSKVQCDLCGKTFAKKINLIYHLRIHNEERNYECPDCDKSFITPSHLSFHQRIHNGYKPHVCKICKKAFSKSSNLNVHLLVHENVKRFLCTICNKKFSQKIHLISHQRLHTGDRPFACHCGAAFIKETDLKKHEKIHTGKKDYLCNFCGSLFSACNDLNRHLLMHSEKRKTYICNICFKNFTRLSSLNRHKKKIHES